MTTIDAAIAKALPCHRTSSPCTAASRTLCDNCKLRPAILALIERECEDATEAESDRWNEAFHKAGLFHGDQAAGPEHVIEQIQKRIERECERVNRNRLAEAFIRGLEVGAEQPDLAGDGNAMYQSFRDWRDAPKEPTP